MTPSPSRAAGAKRLRGIYVLFVEDNPETQAIISRCLRHHGAYVQAVRHGIAALRVPCHRPRTRARGRLLDTRDFRHRAARTDPQAGGSAPRRTPAILFSAFGELGEVARRAGFDVYLVKPVGPRVLLEEIARLAGV